MIKGALSKAFHEIPVRLASVSLRGALLTRPSSVRRWACELRPRRRQTPGVGVEARRQVCGTRRPRKGTAWPARRLLPRAAPGAQPASACLSRRAAMAGAASRMAWRAPSRLGEVRCSVTVFTTAAPAATPRDDDSRAEDMALAFACLGVGRGRPRAVRGPMKRGHGWECSARACVLFCARRASRKAASASSVDAAPGLEVSLVRRAMRLFGF